MKGYGKWIFISILILAVVGLIIYLFFSNKTETPPSDASKMSTDISVNMQNNNETNQSSDNQITHKEVISETEHLEEKELSHFSTKIMDDDNHRDNNMDISLSKLNEKVVKNVETFSFNDIVGSPTPEKGYEKAGVFVADKYKKDYGGGNCQVSTTLYNAVLKADGLDVVERHEHTQEVYYVKKGKDAAVAYGELDFKFKNSAGNDIKIYAEMTDKEVKIKIVKLG